MSDWSNILGRRDDPEKELTAELENAAADPNSYRPATIRPRAQMAFTVVERDGTMHGFAYHTLRHPKHQLRDGEEFLSFTADGIAVVLQGNGLKVIYLAMIRYALAEVREYDGRPVADGTSSRITRLAIIDPQEQEPREPTLRRVK